LRVPKNAYALVAFAHGSGSSRMSPRNTFVARALNDRGIATLLFDLLTPAEEADRANVFNISLLADRLADAVRWLDGQASIDRLPLGLFGASTGAAAALVAAQKLPRRVGAVVSRGGRPDLAETRSTTCTHRPCWSSAAPILASSSSTSRRLPDCEDPKRWRSFPARAICFPNPAHSRR
jgi:pimeloyl-ACP methyl ester carboxylesterase